MEDIEELIEVIQRWHASKVKQLTMVSEASDDVEIQLQGKDGSTVTIPAEQVKVFKLGVGIALEQFAKLPFTVNEEEE